MVKAIKHKEVYLTAKPHVRIWNIETNRCARILDYSSEENFDEKEATVKTVFSQEQFRMGEKVRQVTYCSFIYLTYSENIV